MLEQLDDLHAPSGNCISVLVSQMIQDDTKPSSLTGLTSSAFHA